MHGLRRLFALLVCVALLVGLIGQAGAAPRADEAPGQPSFARGAIHQRPYAVMIDNHPNAYPQTGLDHALVVYEALAEFGITRFMAVYAPGVGPDAPAIGPVRSARLYFVQWAMGMQALYAHAGGSPQGLALAESTDRIANLDALRRGGGSYFARSRKRYAPHNLYTSSADLARAAAKLGVADLSDSEIGFLFKADAPETDRPAAQSLTYYFLSKQASVGWTYDRASNSYARLRQGKPARDAATREQLRTRNVVVIEVQERKIPGDKKGRIEQDVLGSGPGRLFQDGQEREITWHKDSADAPLRFDAADGAEVSFNAGQVWIAAIPSLANLKVK